MQDREYGDGFYAQFSKEIRRKKDSGVLVIDRDRLANAIDLTELSREELEDRCSKAMAACSLYQNGFRSFVRGEGVYIDAAVCTNPILLRKLVENAQAGVNEKVVVLKSLEKILQRAESINNIPGQLSMNVNNNIIEPEYIEDLSLDEITEVLRQIANGA